jgi:hypothetical protein
MSLRRNVGSFDSAARAVIGSGLLIAANHRVPGTRWAGLAWLVCAVARFCPLWWVLRINTGRKELVYSRPSRWPHDEN